MIVVVGADRPVLLADDADCSAFHVAHVGGDLAGGLATIGGHLGDDGDARVPVRWVRAASSAPAEALDGMLAYASSKGWVDGEGAGALIRAHVEAGGP